MKLARCVAAMTLAVASAGAAAQAWSPQKNVEIVAGSAPGGSNDKTARAMERILLAAKRVPSTLTVVNKPGGGGSIAYTYVSRRPGDAHYLYIASSGLLSNHIVGASSLSHADFTPIALLYEDAAVFAVRAEHFVTGAALHKEIEQQDMDPTGPTASKFNAMYRAERARWTRVAKDAGLKAD